MHLKSRNIPTGIFCYQHHQNLIDHCIVVMEENTSLLDSPSQYASIRVGLTSLSKIGKTQCDRFQRSGKKCSSRVSYQTPILSGNVDPAMAAASLIQLMTFCFTFPSFVESLTQTLNLGNPNLRFGTIRPSAKLWRLRVMVNFLFQELPVSYISKQDIVRPTV